MINVDQVRAAHALVPATGRCGACNAEHPCITHQLADEVERLRASQMFRECA